ncbi:MAG TPA: hypothetical protein VFO88_07185 [Gaiellaceae bacterium]|nr:hypothetical protein [Gaiellaceae bacterium]
MALLQRRTDERETTTVDDDVATERAGASPGIVRALFTLAGVAGAGLLLWLAQLFNLDEASGFWVAAGIVAAAGLALGLSQLFGGWTKWGWPTMSPMMFLLAFIPTLVVGGILLLAWQPDGGEGQEFANDVISTLGVGGLVDALEPFMWVVPLVIGLVFSFTFDTTGPRTRIVDTDGTVLRERVVTHDREAVPDEDVHDYRGDDDRRDDGSVAEELRERDRLQATRTTTDGDTRVDRDRI